MDRECPICSSEHLEVLESRLCSNGSRRRRYVCCNCEHRWTSWSGPRPRIGGEPGVSRPSPPRQPPLSDAEFEAVLLSRDIPHRRMAQQLGRSAEAIRQIRIGGSHQNRMPHLARWREFTSKLSCYHCAHWIQRRCSFGLPDPLEEGPSFAADCDLYAA